MKYFITTLMIALSITLLAPGAAKAVDLFNSKKICTQKNLADESAVCTDKELNGQNPLYGSNGIITKVVGLLSIAIGVAAVIMIMVAGFKFITSGSNPQEVTKAREIVLYALVGLALAAAAQLLVRVFLSKIGGP